MDLSYLTDAALDHFITEALKEDVGNGDHSSLGAIPEGTMSSAELRIKDTGIIAGIELAKRIFSAVDAELEITTFVRDGDRVETGQIGLEVAGNAASILTAERSVLNCLQRMSGIATKTAEMVQMISHTKAKLLDTRKTTPNARIIEKWGVAIGGGQNHRFGLFDMVMLKDNHVDFAGGITNAVTSTRNYLDQHGLELRIEVETRNLEEVREALSLNVDVIMLDNFELGTMKEAVEMVQGRCLLEASGGITESTIVDIAETGVDYISVGALTHSYKSLDMSLKARLQ